VAVIRIEVDDQAVNLEIRDEGHGFSPEVLTGFLSGTHLLGVGMAGMRERVRDMGGSFDVRSSEQGASINVSLMLSTKAQAAKA
jgi:signal transduction histidine kinase